MDKFKLKLSPNAMIIILVLLFVAISVLALLGDIPIQSMIEFGRLLVIIGQTSIYVAVAVMMILTGLALFSGIIMTIRAILRRVDTRGKDEEATCADVHSSLGTRNPVPNRVIYTKFDREPPDSSGTDSSRHYKQT